MSDREFAFILTAWFLAALVLWVPFLEIFSRWSPRLRTVLAARSRSLENRRQAAIKARLRSVSVTVLPTSGGSLPTQG
jgi:hypothetical protein